MTVGLLFNFLVEFEANQGVTWRFSPQVGYSRPLG